MSFRRTTTAVVAGALSVAAAIALAPTASAGTVEEVCAESLYVRTQPAGVIIGTLFKGDHMEVSRYSEKGWAEGYAMGHVNQRGWVQGGWFC